MYAKLEAEIVPSSNRGTQTQSLRLYKLVFGTLEAVRMYGSYQELNWLSRRLLFLFYGWFYGMDVWARQEVWQPKKHDDEGGREATHSSFTIEVYDAIRVTA